MSKSSKSSPSKSSDLPGDGKFSTPLPLKSPGIPGVIVIRFPKQKVQAASARAASAGKVCVPSSKPLPLKSPGTPLKSGVISVPASAEGKVGPSSGKVCAASADEKVGKVRVPASAPPKFMCPEDFDMDFVREHKRKACNVLIDSQKKRCSEIHKKRRGLA